MAQDDHEFEFDQSDLDSLENETNRFMRIRFVFFLIRWTIGFLIVWWITTRWPDLVWLWWPAVIVASLSLFMLLFGQRWIDMRLRQTRAKIDQMEKSVQDLDED